MQHEFLLVLEKKRSGTQLKFTQIFYKPKKNVLSPTIILNCLNIVIKRKNSIRNTIYFIKYTYNAHFFSLI